MFKKVLIANRGEIACRIEKTLRKMGILSVAVYSDADRNSKHVLEADESYALGDGPAKQTYLDIEKIISIAKSSGAEAIHPGYGFLSENAEFAKACTDQSIVFIGPRQKHILDFGLKHRAREIAESANVPLLPGSGVLSGVDEALVEAARIGYPVMLKSTAGGGGIGMRLCHSEDELKNEYIKVSDLAANNFGNTELFLEKFVESARHIEVQIFGDQHGTVRHFGERDCSVQRRNQKVIEETPAPGLSDEVRKELHNTAVNLAKKVDYESAGTVEFIYDRKTNEFYFLEVNTRLQVEHGVTEEVYEVDLVEWMIRVADGQPIPMDKFLDSAGHAIELRIYAEDPNRGFLPSSGLLSHVEYPEDVRMDTWVESGTEVSALYDPLLAKLVVKESGRDACIAKTIESVGKSTFYGVRTNLSYLKQILEDESFKEGKVYTKLLDGFYADESTFEVLDGGVLTTIQDYPGRPYYWNVGVPPSGPMDDLNFRLGNSILGNDENCAGLECTVIGPTLKFTSESAVCVTGASTPVFKNGKPVAMNRCIPIKAGDIFKVGAVGSVGKRVYILFSGGLDVPEYLGSRSTFDLGKFGGHCGRKLLTGDVIPLKEISGSTSDVVATWVPEITNAWKLRVLYGPHGAPDFFTDSDMESFFSAEWKVHYNSARTGVRLIGPKPDWARNDGGEAGLHPSNIHDNAYAVGSVDFTGDMPVILGPDGPSLGGFVCPVTVIRADLWKCGQLNAGDTVRFELVKAEEADELYGDQEDAIQNLKNPRLLKYSSIHFKQTSPVLNAYESKADELKVVHRRSGESNLLIEYGEPILDIKLRAKAQALMGWLRESDIDGITDLTPGIRSVQIQFDPKKLKINKLSKLLVESEDQLQPVDEMEFPSRKIRLPLSWDDPSTQLAIEKYQQSVRKDAPWCPSNIEFIRRINGLDSIEQVKDIVFNASYLVMGLGDVYLGAPVATPLDPRHRLVTTKYNPARTWTPENAVGIGGAYLCIYGMEGPGGYQFVGRTIQMWNRYRQTRCFEKGSPWLLRFFDQIQFYPVSTDELLQMREDFIYDHYSPEITEERFSVGEYIQFLENEHLSISAFQKVQRDAFEAERRRWEEQGQEMKFDETFEEPPDDGHEDLDGLTKLEAPMHGSVWKVLVEVGDEVTEGQELVLIESMKMEVPVKAATSGVVKSILSQEGQPVHPGKSLLLIK